MIQRNYDECKDSFFRVIGLLLCLATAFLTGNAIWFSLVYVGEKLGGIF